MITTEDLEKLIKEIDNDFNNSNVPMRHRTLDCIGEISKRLNVKLPIAATKEKSELSENARISYIISEWYKRMYGSRLHINIDIGYMLLLLRSELVVCRVPYFVGKCNFFIEEDLSYRCLNHETNILKMIDGMTQNFADSLSDNEKEGIFTTFNKALEASVILSNWMSFELKMMPAAMNDLLTVKDNIKSNLPHLSNAKWSYNQFIEKVIKSWLLYADPDKDVRKFNHYLRDLVKEFNNVFVEQLSTNDLDIIKGVPGLRYDQVKVTKSELILVQEKIFDAVISIGFKPSLS